VKTKHYKSVAVTTQLATDLVRVEVHTFPEAEFIGAFFVPTSSLDGYGNIPPMFLRARIKHDFKVTFDEMAYCKL
jgi:hypothetical protein